MPQWVVNAFYSATNEWLGMRACSLDESFGAKPRTIKRMAQMKLRSLAFHKVQIAARAAKQHGNSINISFFDELSEKIGLGKTALQELYYGKRNRKPLTREKSKKRGITKK